MAENGLGTCLKTRNLSRDAVTIGSKRGYTYLGSRRLDAPIHEVKDLSLDTLAAPIVESRDLVGDCLQLYQVHSATLESKALENTDVLRELLRLRSNRLVIGLTVSRHDGDGQLRLGDPARDGAGKGPSFVPEHLALEQRCRNRRAVDCDESVRPTRAGVVNGSRNDLFTGAGLAAN
jgi:hypothetical protein